MMSGIFYPHRIDLLDIKPPIPSRAGSSVVGCPTGYVAVIHLAHFVLMSSFHCTGQESQEPDKHSGFFSYLGKQYMAHV